MITCELSLNQPYPTYELSEEAAYQGTILNELQRAVISNRLAEIVQTLINLSVASSEDRDDFFQNRAYLQGQHDVLKYMLTASDNFISQS